MGDSQLRYVIIHGHFYQPPRESPWTGLISPESGAAPFVNWNERILSECYAANGHAILMQNFVNAILEGEPLIAPGAEGIHSVELANAILFSSLLGQTLELPLDSAAYERKLNELIAGSKRQKKVIEISNEDFTKSFNR